MTEPQDVQNSQETNETFLLRPNGEISETEPIDWTFKTKQLQLRRFRSGNWIAMLLISLCCIIAQQHMALMGLKSEVLGLKSEILGLKSKFAELQTLQSTQNNNHEEASSFLSSLLSDVKKSASELTDSIIPTETIDQIKDQTVKGYEVLKDQTTKSYDALKDHSKKGYDVFKDQTAKGYDVLKDQTAKGYDVLKDKTAKSYDVLKD